MSDDTLTSIITDAIKGNLRPILRFMYLVLTTVAAGTAIIVGMWYDLRQHNNKP
jgi:hypothetical protein